MTESSATFHGHRVSFYFCKKEDEEEEEEEEEMFEHPRQGVSAFLQTLFQDFSVAPETRWTHLAGRHP